MRNLIYICLVFSLINLIKTETSFQRFQCYNCNSSEIEECATEPSSNLNRTECEEDEKYCLTKVTNEGYVIRSCTNTTQHVGEFDICEEPFCNLNIFPSSRLKCYICKDEDCFEPSSKYFPKICPIYKKNDQCITQVIDEIDAMRDCKSNIKENLNFMVTCSGNGCNYLNGFVKMSCLECNSTSDINCKSIKSEVQTCNFNMLLGRKEKTCFTYHKFENVIRGCYRDGGELHLEQKFFEACENNNCNNKPISVPKCIICGPGTSDPNCNENKIEMCNENISSCYSCVTEITDIIRYQRGCGQFTENKVSNITCYNCIGDGCNIKPFRKCYKCNSKTNPNCVSALNLTESEYCDMHDSDCLTTINIYGDTERGCFSKTFNTTHSIKSEKCKTDLCNKEIYPQDRRQCFRCNGTDDCSVKQHKEWSEPCPKYIVNDSCFEFIKDGKNIYRGCYSDPGYAECVNNTIYGCLQCVENNCNNKNVLHKRPTQQCYNCNENDKDCGWSQDLKNLKSCQKYIPLNISENCYTYILQNGNISRGCVWDDQTCLNGNNNNCSVCENKLCNNQLITPEKCIQVNIDDDDDNDKDLKRSVCTAEKQTYDKRGCYIRRTGTLLSFGCISDLTTEQYDDCKNNSRLCHTCTDDECENMKIPEREGKKPKLNCYTCNENDENCQWTQKKYSMPCKNYYPNNETESCFIRKLSSEKFERGCSYDKNVCLNTNEKFCDICFKNDCNSKLIFPQECIQISYKLNEKKEKDLEKSICENTEQFLENRGCYVKKNDNIFTWGCIVDLSKNEFKNCTLDTTKCSYCKDEDCTTMKAPNSGSKTNITSLAFIVFVVIQFF